jgi:NAD(P)-dependent dehydrogenase (short-subunit alcohol dehydrogenase family)
MWTSKGTVIMGDFSEKHVLVTGGSRGIGRAVSEAFAGRGARVALAYRTDERAVRAALAAMPGGPHVSLQADLALPDAARAIVEEAVRELGHLDIVVNNAGIALAHQIDQVDGKTWEAAWQQTLAVNLLGPARVTYHAVRHMMRRGGGRIVNISSRGAFRGEPNMPAYGASKAGLNAMSQSLAQKLAPHHIFIGVVAPGFVETDMAAPLLAGAQGDEIRRQSPLGRVARPEEVAAAVLFLCAEGTEYLTGAIIDVNGASYLRS